METTIWLNDSGFVARIYTADKEALGGAIETAFIRRVLNMLHRTNRMNPMPSAKPDWVTDLRCEALVFLLRWAA